MDPPKANLFSFPSSSNEQSFVSGIFTRGADRMYRTVFNWCAAVRITSCIVLTITCLVEDLQLQLEAISHLMPPNGRKKEGRRKLIGGRV
ncbi:hypothetical protein NPIL_538301 [Nephila pilipes]|uniref:Uncharacterized protein n=1 Tax=Nephila pilipes TaxID=299642 RepID=A0A8X6TN20_NEPPI|nr:hypothetical protein NPIL_538301 [Nephila pilipes]